MGPLDPDTWQELGDALRSSPLRTLLTMAGVFWGTLILVLMLGFSDGLESATTQAMGQITNAVYVWGERTRLPYRGRLPGRKIAYDTSDLAAVSAIPGIRHIAPRNQLGGYSGGTPVTRGIHTGAFQVMGDMPAMAHIFTLRFDAGRFVSEIDIRDNRKVAVIGREVQKTLFPEGEDPIGRYIAIRGVFFQVVGLFHSESGEDDGDRADATIHVPFTTFGRTFNFGDRIGWFALTGEDDVSGEELERRVTEVLADRHDVHPDDERAIGSYNAQEDFERIQGLFRGIKGLTWIVGTATVLSGAIGVSNVLMIVVRERTREIGVRRALGATGGAIVGMVVQEALLMTGVSGGLGLVAGVGIVELVGLAIGPGNESFGQPHVEPLAALAGGALLLIAGLVASVLPAQRAVAIEPVAALRAE